MRINTNVMALNAQNKLTINQSAVEKSIYKLSSGFRINSAADDAAGLAISEKMRAQIRGLGQAEKNAYDGISLIQTAEGALQQTTDILQRMRELVIKAQNTGILTSDDKNSITTELSTLKNEIDRIASSTTFNSKKLLDGSLGAQTNNTIDGLKINVSNAIEDETYDLSYSTNGTITLATDDSEETINVGTGSLSGKISFLRMGISFDVIGSNITGASFDGEQIITEKFVETAETSIGRAAFKIGANTDPEDIIYIGIGDMSSAGLSKNGTDFSISLDTNIQMDSVLKEIDFALGGVASQRATLGAMQNRMEYAINNLTTTQENLTAAQSRIRDVDMASEMVSYTKNNILNQSAMSMLAQANQQPQAILSLLQ